MITPRHFYMMRHGETQANAARIMAGSMDSPLTPRGRAQADAAREVFESLEVRPQAIIHSGLSRARDTAELLNARLNLPMFEHADFAEIHAGLWEGVPYAECPAFLEGWHDPPEGESFAAFFERILHGLRTVLHAEEHQPPLIVCHGGVMRALGRIYGLNTPARFANCEIYEFVPNPEKEIFPWDVWHHACIKTGRRPAAIYEEGTPAAIAS